MGFFFSLTIYCKTNINIGSIDTHFMVPIWIVSKNIHIIKLVMCKNHLPFEWLNLFYICFELVQIFCGVHKQITYAFKDEKIILFTQNRFREFNSTNNDRILLSKICITIFYSIVFHQHNLRINVAFSSLRNYLSKYEV